jgi:cellulose biosynthesis protein BcsQ
MTVKIAIANLKGGVGKSTTTMMLADALSLHAERKVLVVDLDPQANVSQMMLSFEGLKQSASSGKTITAWIESLAGISVGGAPTSDRKTASSSLRTHISGLSDFRPTMVRRTPSQGQCSLWASTPDLRFAELTYDNRFFQADNIAGPRDRMYADLALAFEEFHGMFDVIIFDCPPGFSTLAQAAIKHADIVVSPLNVDLVSLWSLKSFWVQGIDTYLGLASLKRRFALLTMVQGGRGAEAERLSVRRDLQEFARERRLSVEIPHSVQALRFVRRPASDSFQSFRHKYGPLADRIRQLGETIEKQIKNVELERRHAEQRSAS